MIVPFARSNGLVVLVALVALLGCSRSGGDSAPDTRAGSAQSQPRPPLPSSAEAPSPDEGGSVLTPEDAEEGAAQRITEQNLESELDRLEREIQDE